MAAPVVEELLYSCMLADPAQRTVRLDQLCATHPEIAAELRERFERLVHLGLVTLGGDGPPVPAAFAAMPERLGPFLIERMLGRGGMGIVYRGTQPSVGNRAVAIKVLRPEFVADPVSEARFVREGLLAGRLQHPNLCPVLDVGKEHGLVYLAMPLIEGESLATKIERAREVVGSQVVDLVPGGNWRASVHWIETIARGLQQAHTRGLIHRDVKPANIMIRPDGSPVLLDFGLAREVEGGDGDLTRSADMLGTPAYMAPEQVDPRLRHADARTDIHALAATLFECLTLRLPREGVSRTDLLRRIASEPATPLRRVAPGVPRDLATCIDIALDPDPDRRYVAADAFADDLSRVLQGRPILAQPPGAGTRTLRWIDRNRIAAAFMAAMLLAIVLSLYLATRLRTEGIERAIEAEIATAEASRVQYRMAEALEAALRARRMDPDGARTLGPLMELLGHSRVATVFELPSSLSGFTTSDDGRWLAVATSDDTQVLSVDEPDSEPLSLRGADPRSLIWMPGGDVLALFDDDTVRRVTRSGTVVWRQAVPTADRAPRLPARPGLALAKLDAVDVAFVGTRTGEVLLLAAADGSPTGPQRLEVAPGTVNQIAALPARPELMVSVHDGEGHASVHLLSVDGKIHDLVAEHHGIVSKLLVDAHGWYASFSGSSRELRSGRIGGPMPRIEALSKILKAKGKIRDVALDRGRLAVAIVDEAVVFDLDAAANAPAETAAAMGQPRELRIPHQGAVSAVLFDPDGESLITATSDAIARRWELQRGMVIDVLVQSPATQMLDIAAAPSGRVFVHADDGRVQVLESPSRPFLRVGLRFGLAQLVTSWDAAGTLRVSLVGSGGIATINALDGRVVAKVEARDGPVHYMARFVTGATADPFLWGLRGWKDPNFFPIDPDTGHALAEVALPSSSATTSLAACASRDGRACALLRLDDRETDSITHVTLLHRGDQPSSWQIVRGEEQHDSPSRHLCLLDATHVVLGGFDGSIRITDLDACTRLLWHARNVPVRFVQATPDATGLLAGFSDGGLCLIDVVSGAATAWEGHDAAIQCGVFSADGGLAATADATGELALWEARTGQLICRWRGHSLRVESLSFAPDGQRLASGSRDGTVAIWPVDPALVDQLARNSKPRSVAVRRATR